MAGPAAVVANQAASDVVVDSPAAADEATAREIAARFGHSVLVNSLTTESTLTRALPDGAMQFVSSALPQRANVDGEWKAIDLALAKSADGATYRPRVAAIPVEFSAGGRGPLARIRDSGGHWIEEASPFGALPAPIVEGAVVTYREVLPGVDLRATATATGMSEVLVVKTAAAATNPLLAAVRFGVSGGDVSADVSGNARISAPGSGGLTASAPTWWDSTGGSDAAGPAGRIMPTPVEQDISTAAVTLRVKDALGSRAVKYPVFIDPDWSGNQNSFWYVDQAYPTQSYLNGNQAGGVQRMGYCNSTCASNSDSRNHLARAFWAMNTAGIAGKQVSAAQFSVVLSGAYNCAVARQADLWTTSAAPVGGTWNQTGSVYVQAIGSATPGSCGSAVGFNALIGAQQAAAAGASQTTLALRANNEGDNAGWKKWAQGATLTVTYNSVPATPSGLTYTSPVRNCSTDASNPTPLDGTQPVTFQANVSDADAGQNLSTTFNIDGVSPTAYSSAPASSRTGSGASSVSVAANTFVAGGVFKWHATTNDGVGGVSPASGDCYFRSVTTSPTAPTVVKTSSTALVVGKSLTVTFGSKATDGVKLFAFWWVIGNATPTSTPATTAIVPGAALPPCGSGSGAVRYVCPDSGSLNAANVSVAPIDTVSTLWVASYNDAGRVSVSGATYSAGSLKITASPDTVGVSNAQGHIWDSTDLAASATAVPDLNTTAGSSGSTTRQVLNTTSFSSVNPLTTDDFDGIPTTTLRYASGSGASAAERPAIDTKGSFTATAWVYLSPTAGAVAHTAVSQQSGSTAAFSLGTDGAGKTRFCRTSLVNQNQVCATGATLQKGTWIMLTGVWDSVNQNLRVLVNDSIVSSGIAPQSVPANDTSSADWFCVGGNCAYTGTWVTTAVWEGRIYRPGVFPGVVSSTQLAKLQNVLSPNDSEPPVSAIGDPITIGCSQLITPQEMYDYDPNLYLGGTWTPTAGSPAQKAQSWNGLGCQAIRETGGVTMEISVASIKDRGTMDDLRTAASTGTPVSGYGDVAYFKTVGGFGELQIFKGKYWMVFRYPWATAAADFDPLPQVAFSHLP